MPRPRLSYEQAELRGSTTANAGRFKSRSSAPKVNGNIGTPPKYLTTDEKKTWKEIVAAIPHGVAGHSDRFAVEMAARLLAQFRTDPLMQSSRLAILMNLLSRLGLDPQARTRLQVASSQTKSNDTLTRYLDAIPNAVREPIQ